MTAHEVRFRPLMRFEAAREAGGGSTTIYGADLGEARVFVANNEYIRSGRTGYDHAGTRSFILISPKKGSVIGLLGRGQWHF
jgi:hypothetical protein